MEIVVVAAVAVGAEIEVEMIPSGKLKAHFDMILTVFDHVC